MNNIKSNGPCSPYLQRPLRSLDQALRDRADNAQKDDKPSPKPLDLTTLLHFPIDKAAA
ncbi:MAG: hypothetical protein HQ502_04945 [Alphaproteobacteria bacterium]|nr:hypothetical protein [Alphaproteobacteria bacterium]